MKFSHLLALLVCVSISLSGCVQGPLVPPGQALNPAPAEGMETDLKLYRFQPGDSLRILVYGEDDLSDTYRINEEGGISFPLIGAVNVEALNVYEAEALIAEKLKEGYLKEPYISIEVAEYRPFSVLGGVKNAGNYDYKEGFSIADAIATSGGFTPQARRDQFETLRRTKEGWSRVYTTISDPLYPGDVVYVGEGLF